MTCLTCTISILKKYILYLYLAFLFHYLLILLPGHQNTGEPRNPRTQQTIHWCSKRESTYPNANENLFNIHFDEVNFLQFWK